MTLTNNTYLDAEYYDGETISLTVGQFKKKFRQEGKDWLKQILFRLEKEGSVNLRFARYKIHDNGTDG